jgi:hypothetical protein
MHVSWIGMRQIGQQMAPRVPAAAHSLQDHALRCRLDEVAVCCDEVANGRAAMAPMNPGASNECTVSFAH